ncbi:MAG: YihY family inner membrane protein [Phycisphaerales bacterium]|nr:YihY family inner membrane protein [Phycisphaerae bacterium]NNF44422.1 YihY family inner membrane protein [Phycisphaerales bacterium]NNM24658.1 YihY family inner membrane protein [Phycisphaerales bacterium]
MKVSEYIHVIGEWLKRVVTEPRSELTHWQSAARYTYDLGQYGTRQLARDRAPQMAAALSFRTLFALVPLLVVGTILVRAFGGLTQFQATFERFLETIGGRAAADADADGATRSVSSWLLELTQEAQNINLTAVGWIGVAVLVYSTVSLMVTIESCFNSICRAPEGRGWMRRVPVYWTIVTLAPAAITLTVFVDRRFDEFIVHSISWRWALQAAPVLWSFLATTLLMFVIYKLLPNTSVRARPALVGAFVAAMLLELGKRIFGVYLDNAVGVNVLYGSLGLIPIFMLWMYVMWLVVLFGLEVAATLQVLGGRRPDEMEARERGLGLVDPASILSVMEVVAERFRRSAATTPAFVAEKTGLPERTVHPMFERLVEGGFLHRLDRDDGGFSLARPPEQVRTDELLEIGFAMVDEGRPRARQQFLDRLREAQRTLAAGATLAQLLPAQPVGAED